MSAHNSAPDGVYSQTRLRALLATSHIFRYLFRPDNVLEFCHVILLARGVIHRPGMLLLFFVIFLLAALDGFAPAVADDLACADVYIFITRQGPVGNGGENHNNTSQPPTSLHRCSRTVSLALSRPSSSCDVLHSHATDSPSQTGLAHSHRQPLRAADEIGPVCSDPRLGPRVNWLC